MTACTRHTVLQRRDLQAIQGVLAVSIGIGKRQILDAG